MKSKKSSSSSSLLCLRRGDDVLFDVLIDGKTKKFRAYNVHQTKNENHVDQLKRARAEKMEQEKQESMSRAAAAAASGGGGVVVVVVVVVVVEAADSTRRSQQHHDVNFQTRRRATRKEKNF